jgi:hypothetical protein
MGKKNLIRKRNARSSGPYSWSIGTSIIEKRNTFNGTKIRRFEEIIRKINFRNGKSC